MSLNATTRKRGRVVFNLFQVLDTQSMMFSMDSSGDFLEIVEIEIWTLQVPLMNPYKVAM
jgi:hypothetical protein